MSISTQLARIQASRDTIRTKLVELGLAAPDAQLDALATVISEIANQGAVSIEIKENTSYTIPAGYHNGSGVVKAITDPEGDAGRYLLQVKTVTPTEAEQVITSDDGYYGLESVTVFPIPESYVKPEGTKEITENGTHDVKTYESVSVNVPEGEDLNEVLAEQEELIETLRTTLEGKAAGGSGKEPVLGELVVTENGMYDKPVIAALEITSGAYLTFREPINLDYESFPAEWKTEMASGKPFKFYSDGAVACLLNFPATGPSGISFSNLITGQLFIYMDNSPDPTLIKPNMWLMVQDNKYVKCEPPSITVVDTGSNIQNLTAVKEFFDITMNADGWNKVTVNVARDVVDVEELPTESIDPDKIYRLTEAMDPYVNIYVNMSAFDTPMTLEEYAISSQGFPPEGKFVFHLFDSLKTFDFDTMIPFGRDGTTFHVYISKEDGTAIFTQGEGYLELMRVVFNLSPDKNRGIVSSVEEANLSGDSYCIVIAENNKTIYGIPDEANNKIVMEYNGSEWVECGSSSSGMELNIAYGDTPPEDTTKLWCKCDEPSGVTIAEDIGKDITYTGTISGAVRTDAEYPLDTASVDGKIYSFYKKSVHCFDTKTETGSVLPVSIPVTSNMYWESPAIIGDTIYLYKDGHIFTFDTKTQLTAMLDVELTPTPNSGYRYRPVAVGTRIYSFSLYSAKVKVQRYDTITGDLTTLSTDGEYYINRATTFAYGKYIYFFGGDRGYYTSSNSINTEYAPKIERFNVETEMFDTPSKALFPDTIGDFGKIVHGSRIYLIGGYLAGRINNYNNHCNFDNIWCFDACTETITECTTRLPEIRIGGGGVCIGDVMYYLGGLKSNNTYGSPATNVLKYTLDKCEVADSNLLIVPSINRDKVKLINVDSTQIELGVAKVYKGNAENIGELVEAYLYKNGAWTLI